MKTTTLRVLLCILVLIGFGSFNTKPKWISLFNGKNLEGWSTSDNATWEVKDGVITGTDGRGHLYANPFLKDLEIKGELRISSQGNSANGGLYFSSQCACQGSNAFPQGYEAKICNSQDAYTGWPWKPGTPTGKASALLTKDGEWFPMRVQAIGSTIKIWVKDQLVMTQIDDTYNEGHFALQCHNAGMIFEARNLYYKKLK
ncbi:3-keto-disaccharide hydrolase [Dyadobacter jejuensis]|uniref:3-keto-disaccharide hydrolase n=1 Tax=Dyadobacter jejuensis TaxID=1082580 RepID=UPI001304D55E|nr:DUF1080 domain-containing protein [Dyadobacter jejuensis]